METLAKQEGLITKVIGPVVDIEFQQGELPKIYTALHIQKDDGTFVVAEVQQMLGSNRVRTVAMSSTDGLRRGMKVINTGEPIKIPVGKSILGRILNVTGDPVDEMGAIETDTYLPIHRESPKLTDQNTNVEILETGIKAIDLLQPYQKGGKIGLFGGAGVGKTVLTQGFAKGLGITEAVNSPTFTIIQEYTEGRLPFYHFDVYRIGDIEEMEEIGYDDYFFGEGVCLIEWAELIEELIPEGAISITIEKDLEKGFDYRKITVE